MVLPIAGPDIGTISSGNSVVLWFGLDEQSQALVFIIYQKARQQFRQMEFKFPIIGNTCSSGLLSGDYTLLEIIE